MYSRRDVVSYREKYIEIREMKHNCQVGREPIIIFVLSGHE